jgi:hypothetical protein
VAFPLSGFEALQERYHSTERLLWRPILHQPADHYFVSPDVREGVGTDWVAAAFDVTVLLCFTETRERRPLLFTSARAGGGHAVTIAGRRKTSAFLNREAGIQELLWINGDDPWKRSFQFRPFAVDIVGADGVWVIAILQQLVRKRSEHASESVDKCKRLAFQSLSVTLQTANARMLRSRGALVIVVYNWNMSGMRGIMSCNTRLYCTKVRPTSIGWSHAEHLL